MVQLVGFGGEDTACLSEYGRVYGWEDLLRLFLLRFVCHGAIGPVWIAINDH